MSDEQTPVAEKKKPGRPRRAFASAPRPAALDPNTMTPSQMLEAMTLLADAIRSNKTADVEIAADIHAKAMKKALHPENALHPGVSVYNTRGETEHPRPKPTQIFMLAKYPICDPGNYDTTTWAEIELLNQIQPGDYQVTKADGSDVKVLVSTERDTAGKPYKTTLFANGRGIADDDQKNNWPPLLQILTQIVTGEGPVQSYARLHTRIAELEAKLSAATAA